MTEFCNGNRVSIRANATHGLQHEAYQVFIHISFDTGILSLKASAFGETEFYEYTECQYGGVKSAIRRLVDEMRESVVVDFYTYLTAEHVAEYIGC